MLDSLFENADNIIVFDLETTGINVKHDEIIEMAAVRCVDRQGELQIEDEFDLLVQLSKGNHLPEVIVELTGITEERLLQDGVSKEEACRRLVGMLQCSKPLLVAYNAQFDLCFLYYFLNTFQKAGLLKSTRLLDALTVYKDRRPYPHKLKDAVAAYSLNAQNTHRAIADTKAALELLCKMGQEEDDLTHYINLFGYNPRYGISGPRISSVTYLPQGYEAETKLYEETAPLL